MLVEREILVNQRHGHRALSDCRRDALDRAVSEVSGNEHPWLA